VPSAFRKDGGGACGRNDGAATQPPPPTPVWVQTARRPLGRMDGGGRGLGAPGAGRGREPDGQEPTKQDNGGGTCHSSEASVAPQPAAFGAARPLAYHLFTIQYTHPPPRGPGRGGPGGGVPGGPRPPQGGRRPGAGARACLLRPRKAVGGTGWAAGTSPHRALLDRSDRWRGVSMAPLPHEKAVESPNKFGRTTSPNNPYTPPPNPKKFPGTTSRKEVGRTLLSQG